MIVSAGRLIPLLYNTTDALTVKPTPRTRSCIDPPGGIADHAAHPIPDSMPSLDGPEAPTRLQKWERLHRHHHGHYHVFDLYEDRVRAPHNGQEHDFVRIEARDWVNVLPVTPEGDFVFVRQYRHGTDAFSLEIPGGIIDPQDASPEAAARREMREETGFDTTDLVRLGVVDTNPALFNNRCYTILARDVRPTGTVAFDETEDLEVVRVRPADVPGLVQRGIITHALVVAAFYHYAVWKQQPDASTN